MKDQKFKNLSPIDYLFKRLAMLYPRRWVDQFKTNEELEDWKVCWAEELAERGVNFDEVKIGLNRCIELYDWPPSFPEFLKACRPSLDYESAFNEAVQQMNIRSEGRDEWSNPAIFHAAAGIGVDMNNPYQTIKNRWATALDKAIEGVKNGSLSNVIEKRVQPSGYLPSPKREHGYSEVAKRELARIEEILNREPAWKKNIREKGMNTSSPAVGLTHISENVRVAEPA